jgi:acetyl esterase/lipase
MSFDDLPPQDSDGLSEGARRYFDQALSSSRAAMGMVPNVPDIPYGPDYWQKVDVFRPTGGRSGLPVILFLHGGGWTHGYKEHCNFMAPLITELPAIFVSVSYRLAPTVRFPLPLEDTIAAVAWTYRNIREHGGDPERIFIGGHSAGGHLATFATLRIDLIAASGLPDDVIKGCFPVSSTFKFEIGQLEAMGKLLLERPEDAPQVSALNYITKRTAPFYITWGTKDFDRVMNTSALAVEKFKAVGTPVRSDVFPGADHFGAHILLGEPGNVWLKTVKDIVGSTPGS